VYLKASGKPVIIASAHLKRFNTVRRVKIFSVLFAACTADTTPKEQPARYHYHCIASLLIDLEKAKEPRCTT
jgi:hypothetical protein